MNEKEKHARFIDRLEGSQLAVFLVAEWLNSKGRCVEIPPMHKTPSVQEADNYLDDGDLFIIERKRVEVKQRGLQFTGKHDWPYPDMLVSNKRAVERAIGNVSAYVIVSKDMTHLAIITADTKDKWFITQKRASNTGRLEEFYTAPLDVVQFKRLDIPAKTGE